MAAVAPHPFAESLSFRGAVPTAAMEAEVDR